MSYSARILADSIGPAGVRLTTFEVQYPHIVHAELLTHRVFSRNAASSRAVPNKRRRQVISMSPFVPLEWLAEQPGMTGGAAIPEADAIQAEAIWLEAYEAAAGFSERLSALNVHKSIANRLVEPYMWMTVILSGTEWENFFNLRLPDDAEQHMRKIATLLRDTYESATPSMLRAGEWHLPLFGFPGDEALTGLDRCKVAAGRCARVSYLTHMGTRDPQADLVLCERLAASGHWSPFEHVAMALEEAVPVRNFVGWRQLRVDMGG